MYLASNFTQVNKIIQHIADLLEKYDCVVIPNFGGFVLNTISADLNPVNHTIYPPSRGVSFNQNLASNDGVLTNHIAIAENISYKEAVDLVESFVEELKETLSKKRKVTLERLGVLYFDEHKLLQFKPDKQAFADESSYGLKPLQLVPVEQKEGIEIKMNTEVKEGSEGSKRKYWIAAAAVLVVGLLYFPFKDEIKEGMNHASVSPSGEKEVFKNDSPAVDEKEVVVKEEAPAAEKVKSSGRQNPYHIVGGCFSNYENAQRMLKTMQKEGYQAEIIGKYKGLHVVSYKSLSSRSEAENILTQVKSAHNPEAWILKK